MVFARNTSVAAMRDSEIGSRIRRMSIVSQIGQALAHEFALPSVSNITQVTVRLAMALLLGGLLGWQREHKGQSAGVKTHMLVSGGSALFVLSPLLAGVPMEPVTRVMQGIVSGVGFLGAGAIIKMQDHERIKGLTTAAGIYLTSAIGMTAGMGLEIAAIIASLLALGVFSLIPKIMHQEAEPPADR